MRGLSAAVMLLAVAAAALSAAAQQASPVIDLSPGQVPLFAAPLPADAGKPSIYDPQSAAQAARDKALGCAPSLLQCRVQILGVIQNRGGVELRGTAFTW